MNGFGGSVRTAQAAVPAAVTGELTEPAATVAQPAVDNAVELSRAAAFGAGTLGLYEEGRARYNLAIDRLNAEWTAFTADADRSPESLDRHRAALRSRRQQAEGDFDTTAAAAARLLNRGPDAIGEPGIAALIMRGLRFLPPPPDGTDRTASLRILTLNAGGGKDNAWRNHNGLDPGDIDQLAERILEGDADVANLQEMFGDDLEELEDELEEQSGDDWTLVFSPATQKIHWGGGTLDRGKHPFGNVIAVRASDDGEANDDGISLVDSDTETLDEPGTFLWSDPEGRSMATVTVEAANGERVTISTAHTDYGGVSEQEQAEQIEMLREHTEEFADETGGDHTVLTGDLNHEMDEDNPAGQALRDYVERYDYTDAGHEAGPTADYGDEPTDKYIDYIFTSAGLEVDDVDKIEGNQPEIPGEDKNMSDHDGIVLDVNLDGDGDPEANDPQEPDDDGSWHLAPGPFN